MEGGDNMVHYRTSGTKSGKPDVSIEGVGNQVVIFQSLETLIINLTGFQDN